MIVMTGIGLSMDAFAVAFGKGLTMRKLNIRQMIVIAVYFGAFQAIMPLLGWLLGKNLHQFIEKIDHWIAFILLLVIGLNMISDAVKEYKSSEIPQKCDARIDHKQMVLLSVATSIDAFAVGITFSFLEVSIMPAITLIGAITFTLSVIAVAIGYFIGGKNQFLASIAGGIILIGIGIKILIEHLGFFS